MRILAIDTSCDETSVAVTEGTRALSSVVSSQVRYHKKFGGVVPFLAGRLHQERIAAVTELALARAGLGMADIGAVAVTYGPGLAPALQVGIAHAQELARANGLPLYAVNHMLGHLVSPLMPAGTAELPALGLLLSGGHSEMVLVGGWDDITIVGETLDDALGEAYDKAAKMLGLGYPGGALLARLAATGNPDAYPLPIPMLRSGDLNLSYSGLKNAVRLLVLELEAQGPLTAAQVADVAASFERVAQESVILKLRGALRRNPEVKTILVGGGVAANAALRARVRQVAKEFRAEARFPANRALCTDNAAMIGAAAWVGIESGQQPVGAEKLDRVPNLSFPRP